MGTAISNADDICKSIQFPYVTDYKGSTKASQVRGTTIKTGQSRRRKTAVRTTRKIRELTMAAQYRNLTFGELCSL